MLWPDVYARAAARRLRHMNRITITKRRISLMIICSTTSGDARTPRPSMLLSKVRLGHQKAEIISIVCVQTCI